MSEFTLHSIKDARCKEGSESVTNQTSAREKRSTKSELFASIPLGQQEESTREECGFDKAKEETCEERANKVRCDTRQTRYHPPYHHTNREVQRGSSYVVEEHVSGMPLVVCYAK
jgi:hypothetical protein